MSWFRRAQPKLTLQECCDEVETIMTRQWRLDEVEREWARPYIWAVVEQKYAGTKSDAA